MVKVLTGSIEEIFEQMEQGRLQADSQVQPWQAVAKPGDKVLRIVNFGKQSLAVYSEILDPIRAEKDAGASEEEIEYVRSNYAQDGMKYYRFTKSYSVLCIDGELGDIHVSSIACFMTNEQFENARNSNWPSDVASVRRLTAITGKGGVA